MMRFLLPFVLWQVAAQVSALGSLVFASMNTRGLSGPALMALIQALANAGALLVAQKLTFRSGPKIVFWSAAFFSLLNAVVTLTTSDIYSVTLFLRLLSGALVTGLLLSHGPRILSSDIKKSNQVVQIWASVAALIGFGLAPVLASSIKVLFIVDLVLNITAFGALTVFSRGFNLSAFCTPEESPTPGSLSLGFASIEKTALQVGLVTFLLWCFGGFFHVIEVPLLLQRFGLNNSQVSLVFIFTLILNVGAVSILSRKWVARLPWEILVCTTFLVGLACIAYLNTYSLSLVILCVALIGSANGAFNLSQTTILQGIASPNVRLSSFIFVRLLAQTGLMVGAITAGSGLLFETTHLNDASRTAALPTDQQIKVVEILLQNIPSQLEPYKNTDTGAMLVIHQVFDNLFDYDSRNNLVPNLVETLAWRNNNKTLLLTIKQNTFFSNGDPLRAIDVINSLNEAKKKLGESANWAFGQLQSMRVIHDHQFELTFKRPFTLMPAILASPYFGIFKRGKEDVIIGTGDYIITAKEPHRVTLTRSPVKNSASVDSPFLIHFSDVIDPNTRYSMFDGDVKSLGSSQYLEPVEYRTLQTILFVPNFGDSNLKSKEARCGLISQLSKIAPTVYSQWKPADLGLPFFSDLFPAQAQKKAMNRPNMKKPTIILYSNSAAKFEQAANSQISDTLKSNGYAVSFDQLPIRELAKAGAQGYFSGLMFGFVPDFVHPHALIAPLLGSGQVYNFGRYSNKEVDQLLDQALSKTDKATQNRLYAAALKIIRDDCGIGFLGSQAGLLYLDPEIIHPEIGQLGLHNLKLANLRYKGR